MGQVGDMHGSLYSVRTGVGCVGRPGMTENPLSAATKLVTLAYLADEAWARCRTGKQALPPITHAYYRPLLASGVCSCSQHPPLVESCERYDGHPDADHSLGSKKSRHCDLQPLAKPTNRRHSRSGRSQPQCHRRVCRPTASKVKP